MDKSRSETADKDGRDNKAFDDVEDEKTIGINAGKQNGINSGKQNGHIAHSRTDNENNNNEHGDTVRCGFENPAFQTSDHEDENSTKFGNINERIRSGDVGKDDVKTEINSHNSVADLCQAAENDDGRENSLKKQSEINNNNNTFETPEVYRSRWRSIRVMYFTMFATNVSLTILFSSTFPFLKILDDTVTTGYLGWVVASYSLGQLFAAPLFGAWANYWGKTREPLIVSLFIDVPAHVLYMYLESIPNYAKVFMIVARCMVGFGSGNIAVIRSYVSGATTLEERTGAMANMAVFQSLGFILGPLIQAALVPIGYPGFIHETALSLNMYTFTGLLCAIFDVINLVLLFVVFREHVIDDVVTSPEKGTKSPDDVSDDDTRPLDYVAVISTIVIFFVVMFAFIVIETICTPLCMHSFAWTKAEATLYVGIILGVGGFLSIAVFVVVKFLATRFNERHLLLCGFLAFLIGYFIELPWGQSYKNIQLTEENATLGHFEESVGCPDVNQWCYDTPAILFWQFLLGLIFLAIGYPICYVMCFTIYSKIVGPKPQGVWMGLMTAAGSLARMLGPVYVSKVYDAAGPRVTFAGLVGLICLVIVGLLIVSHRLVPWATNRRAKSSYNLEST